MIWVAIGAGLAAVVASLLITPISIALSHRLRLLDEPGARKVHVAATPRLGGIGIIGAAFLVGVPAFLYLQNVLPEGMTTVGKHHLALAIGALFVFFVGLIDDISSVPARLKLLTILAASAVVCGSGAAFSDIIYSGEAFVEFPWLSWIVTALWITGIAVAFNFIDGLDGLSSGLAVLACLVLAFFLLSAQQFAAAIAPLVLAGSLLGFLYYNWHPAKTFMGDGGSLAIGFLLGAMTVTANPSIGTMRAVVLPALALSVALVDTGLTFFRRRYQQRRSMFSAERGHIHHRLLDRGFKHKQAVLVIYAVSIGCVIIGMLSLNFDGWPTLGGLSLVIPLLWGLFHAAGSVRTLEMVTALRRKRDFDRTSRRLRNTFEDLQLEFDTVNNFSEWWQTICHAGDRLQFSHIELTFDSPKDGKFRTFEWTHLDDRLANESEQVEAKIPVTFYGSSTPSRTATVHIPTLACLESAGERLAFFSRLMAENGQQALRRIHRTSNQPKAPHIKPVKPGEFGHLRVALVHDFFYTYAGAERVVEQIINVFPHCDVFGLFDFLPESERGFLRGKPVKTTFIQNLPFAKKKHRAYLPLMPLAIEQLDVSEYDLVISSSYLVAKGIITGPDQLHLCYCHSPVRYGWDLQHQYLDKAGLGYGPKGMLARMILHYLRTWDVRSSMGVDYFIANSQFVARRIKKTYRRTAEVIPPPVNTDAFLPDLLHATDQNDAANEHGEEPFYLTASRLVSYKRIDLIVEAFTKTLDRKLVVIGDGPERERIEKIAGPNVVLLGHQSEATLIRHMQRAKAFVFAAEEDFGIVPVEAMACGSPIIAYSKGGVTESVKAGRTGLFFEKQTVESLHDAIDRFEQAEPIDDLDRKASRQRAEEYSTDQFIERLTDFARKHVKTRWPEQVGVGTPANLPESLGADNHPSKSTSTLDASEQSFSVSPGEIEP